MAKLKKPKKPKKRPPAFGVFHPRERKIYCYWDGERERPGDPLILAQKLQAVEGLALDVDAKLAIANIPESPKAMSRIIAAVRTVFGVKTLEEGGLTEGECVELLAHFIKFVAGVQKDAVPLPTSPAATGSAGESTTVPLSVFGSTGTDP